MRWFCLTLVLCAVIAHAEVYKSVNERGEIIYSDTPSPGAKAMKLPQLPTYTPPPLPRTSTASRPTVKAGSYKTFSILKPADGSTIWNNLGILQIEVVLDPPLKRRSKHRIQFYLDNEPYATPLDTKAITISNIERGQHTLSASIVDASGAEVDSTGTVSVHVKRESVLHGKDIGTPGFRRPNPNLRTQNPNVLYREKDIKGGDPAGGEQATNPGYRAVRPNVLSPNPNIRTPNPNIITPVPKKP